MLTGITKSSDGKTSSTRVATIAVVATTLVVYVVHNALAMIHGAGLVGLGEAEAALLSAAMLARAAQSYAENKYSAESKEGA